VLSAVASSLPVFVTGASSGIGEEFARQFAERGHDLTIVARRLDRLEALAAELSKKWKVAVTPLAADLSTDEGIAAAKSHLSNAGPWILVNNAGFGSRGRFVELDPARETQEVRLNVVALHELTAAVLPLCKQVGEGGLINVASTAAFQPVPYMSTYAATKAFVLHFTEGLAVELKGTGVRVQVLCPGATRTEFEDVAGEVPSRFGAMAAARAMSSEEVVHASLKAFDRNRTICVPGTTNALMINGARLAPRSAVRRLVAPLFTPRD
jgi:short-subunit dehydrogenase